MFGLGTQRVPIPTTVSSPESYNSGFYVEMPGAEIESRVYADKKVIDTANASGSVLYWYKPTRVNTTIR